jgi:antitoxin ParD1/3/4
MAKNTSVNLSDHFCSFIDEQVAGGRYGSASEVVREGLRLLEERQSRLEALNSALQEGLASGVAEDFDFDEWLSRKVGEAPRDKAA